MPIAFSRTSIVTAIIQCWYTACVYYVESSTYPFSVHLSFLAYHDSEQKLIRQKMDVVPISATVEMEDGLRVPVKLLDCDTISQAKEKLLDCMHKAAPVSKRPKLTEEDLGNVMLRKVGLTEHFGRGFSIHSVH